MARKKDRQSPSKKDFSNTPFKALKGVSVSEPPSTSAAKKAPRQKQGYDSHDEVEFLEEMAFLKVGPIKQRKAAEASSLPGAEKAGAIDTDEPGETGDDALFLNALGKMDATFRDEFPEDPQSHQASPRRMREVERGRRSPEAEIDLHGLTRDEARQKVAYFLDNSCFYGFRTVLVITGRGQRSEEEPVLRSEVERFLENEGRQWAIEWGRAPRRYGGAGAIIVFLRKKS